VLVYGIVFAMGIHYINRLIARGVDGPAIDPAGTGTPDERQNAKFSPKEGPVPSELMN
jgi:cytochrome d ubiquinol oxidase subunit I